MDLVSFARRAALALALAHNSLICGQGIRWVPHGRMHGRSGGGEGVPRLERSVKCKQKRVSTFSELRQKVPSFTVLIQVRQKERRQKEKRRSVLFPSRDAATDTVPLHNQRTSTCAICLLYLIRSPFNDSYHRC